MQTKPQAPATGMREKNAARAEIKKMTYPPERKLYYIMKTSRDCDFPQ